MSATKEIKKVTAKELTDKILKEPIPFDKDVDDAAIERLITSRISLLLNKPFFGNIATRLILRNADEWIPTAATDGRYFYYNAHFVMSLRPKEVDFLVGHEVLHVVYDHMGRRGDRDPQLWNIANDYLVNLDLVNDRIGEKITTVNILFDTKYKDFSSEEVYDDLMQDVKDQKEKQISEETSSNNEPSSQDIKDVLGDLIDKVLDDHLDEQSAGEDGKPGPVTMTDAEKKALRDEVREAVLQAAEQVGASNVPGGVKRMIQDLTEPKISWEELIAQQIESTVKSDFSFGRPSRRSWHMDAIMPGMIPGTLIDVCVAIDTSGSISRKMIAEFLSEVQGIMEQFSDYKIHVWCFDTAIHNPQVYTHDNGEGIAEYEPGGGGGTDFMANYDWMKENDIEPKKFIMFTDGYPCGSWGDENYCETVFIINGNKNIDPPFGIWAHYDEQ